MCVKSSKKPITKKNKPAVQRMDPNEMRRTACTAETFAEEKLQADPEYMKKLKEFVLKRKAQQVEEEGSSNFPNRKRVIMASDADMPQKADKSNKITLKNVFYDPKNNEAFSIGTNVDNFGELSPCSTLPDETQKSDD